MFVSRYRGWLIGAGVVAAILIGVLASSWLVALPLIAVVLLTGVVTTRRDRRDVRAIAERDLQSLSPHAQRLFLREIGKRGTVALGKVGATRTLHDGRVESIRWRDVTSVTLVVVPQAIGSTKVLVSLSGPGVGLVIPYDETPPDLLVRLQALPGFDPSRAGEIIEARRVGTVSSGVRRSSPVAVATIGGCGEKVTLQKMFVPGDQIDARAPDQITRGDQPEAGTRPHVGSVFRAVVT